MQKKVLLLLFLFVFLARGPGHDGGLAAEVSSSLFSMKEKIKVKVGNYSFTATLFENAAAFKLKSMLPLPLTMAELNGNEKYAELPVKLPTDATNPGKIQEGDLMLYGASTLVVFYKSFSTSYSYTKLGKIDNVEGLSSALGSGSVALSLELEQ